MSEPVTDYLGLRALRSVLDLADWSAVGLTGFDKRFIIPGPALDAYKWVEDFVASRGSWPSVAAVESEFSIVLPEDVEDLPYLTEEIVKRQNSFQITNALKKVAKHLDDRDPDMALAELVSFVSKREVESTKTATIRGFRESGKERVKEYEEAVLRPTQGILSPWDEINAATQGWVDGTLNVVMAKPNVGKTWFSCIVANHAFEQEKNVLYVSMEMPSIRIERRLDAVRYKVPFGGLRDADMDISVKDRWADSIKSDVGKEEMWVADKKHVRNVSDIMSLVGQYQPDIVVIDGGYRLSPIKKTKSAWEGTVSIVNDLQIYAELSNVPWVVTTQFGDSNDKGTVRKSGKKPQMNMWGVRYGKEWVINPDTAIILHQEPQDREFKQLRMYLTKVRDVNEETMISDLLIQWDLTDMKFGSLSDPLKGEEETEVTSGLVEFE